MQFVAFATSSTGSLADHSGREVVLTSIKKMLYFNLTPTKQINFQKAEDRDGSIYLSWEKYPFPNLHSMKLARVSYFPNPSTPTVLEMMEMGSKFTSFQDNGFIAPKVVYYLIAENNLGSVVVGNSIEFNGTGSKLTGFKTVGVNQLQITWQRVHFYNNSLGYKILGQLFPSAKDTVAIFQNIPFGNTTVIGITTKARRAFDVTSQSTVYLGKKIPTSLAIIPDPANNRFYYIRPGYLVREQSGVRDSLAISINTFGPHYLSPLTQSLYLPTGNMITEISTTTLTIKNTYPIHTQNIISFVPYGNNFITSVPFGSSFTIIRVVDKSSGSLLQTYGGPSGSQYIDSFISSNDPNYIIGQGSRVAVYKLDPSTGTIESSMDLPTGGSAVFSKDGNFLYTYDFTSYKRFKYTYPALGLMADATIDFTPYLQATVDRHFGVIGRVNGSYYEIRDFEDLTLLRKVLLNGSGIYAFRGGRLFAYVDSNLSYSLDLGF